MACVVEDACTLYLLPDMYAGGFQPIHAQCILTPRVNDKICCQHLILPLIVHDHAGDFWRTICRAVLAQAFDAGVGYEADTGQGGRIASHNEFKCRSPTGEDGEVVILRCWLVLITQGARDAVFKTQLSAASIQQGLKKVGIFFAEQKIEACEKRMAVAEVSYASAFPHIEGSVS